MYIPHFVIQLALLVIFVISAYRAISNLSTKTLLDCLFNAAVAIIAFAYLF
jgi:hypothetical protein